MTAHTPIYDRPGGGTLRQVGDGASAIASFAAALNDPSFSDVSFLCTTTDRTPTADVAVAALEASPEVYHAHRAILAARSPVFRKMLLGDWREASEREVRVENFLARHFYSVLEWAYTGQAHIGARDVLGVMHCASFYGFDDLTGHCKRLAVEFIDVENVLVLLDAALENDQQEIVGECVAFWERHAAEVIEESTWPRLRRAGVELLLSHDTVDCGEAQLFERTLAWLRRNVSASIAPKPETGAAASTDAFVSTGGGGKAAALTGEQQDVCEALLSSIRFSQMTVEDLLGSVKGVVSSVAPAHFSKYVTALEYKLSPKHFDGDGSMDLRPRVPSILGRFHRLVPATFLTGWTRLVEVEGLQPLPANVFASIPPSAVYICVGQRRADAGGGLEFVAVGHIALALKKMPVQQLVEDDKLYWCCHATCFGVQAREWQPQKAAYPTAGVTRGGQFGNVCQFIWPRKTSFATGDADYADAAATDAPGGRFFIFYK